MSNSAVPEDLAAEVSVLGAVMLDRRAIDQVADFLKPEDFMSDNNGQVYRAALVLWEEGRGIDLTTLTGELKRMKVLERVGGPVFLAELQSSVPTAANVEHYGHLVKDASTKRALIVGAGRIDHLGRDEGTEAGAALDQAQSILFAISEGRNDDALAAIRLPLLDAWQELQQIHEDRRAVTGVPSGFLDLDHLTGGFQPGDLIILAARPGVGKTTWSLNVSEHVALEKGLPVGIFSLEMSQRQLIHRLLCSQAGVDSAAMKHGTLPDDAWGRVSKAMGRLAEAPIYIDQSAVLSVTQLRAKARRLKATAGLGLVIVDYLQLMQARTSESREREVAEVSRSLKSLARELSVPIIACSQLNREVEKRVDHRPQLADLRDSGGIEQDSDLVLFLYRNALYNPTETLNDVAELIIAKHRNGPTGKVELLFMASQTRFRNYKKPQGVTA